MNTQKVKQIIKLYKKHFYEINDKEIYKWRAMKCFQDNWDIDAPDFALMLNRSLHLSKNLLDSKHYFPKRMILKHAEANPKFIRGLFVDLYDEEIDLIERILNFKQNIEEANTKHFPGRNHFQDPRAILVYLCLRFPDRYYLYKPSMFKKFIELVDHPYIYIRGKIENLTQYLTLCDLLKLEVQNDNELLELHKTRIKDKEFFDHSFNIFIQDIIYASVKHLPKFKQTGDMPPASERLIADDNSITPKSIHVILKGSIINHIENELEN